MLRTIISRMCRMSPVHHSRVMSPVVVNCVRFKYQGGGSGGGDRGGRRKPPQVPYIPGSEELADEPAERAEHNLLEDK